MTKAAKLALRLLLVGAVFLAVQCGFARAEPAGAIRVMTYNIRLDTEADGANSWSNRRAAVSSLVRFFSPDVFGMQEVRLTQRDQLASDLPDYIFLGFGRDDGRDGGEFSPLAYRADRFSLVENGGFWLSQTPDRPSRGWDAAFPRIVTWARLRDRRTGRRLLALATHWDHVGREARFESGRMLASWITSHHAACEIVVLLGDLNATQSEASVQALMETGSLLDARDESETPPFGPAGTFNGFDITHVEPAPIDHILLSRGVRTLRFGVLTQQDAGRLPSDHFPVLADTVAPRCHGR